MLHPQDINPHYGDVYARGGLEEKRYTFLHLQNLPARMAAYHQTATPPFTIAELGFGLGLTFLATIEEWLKATNSQPPTLNSQLPSLHYISYELHPWPWQTLFSLWEDVAPQSPALPLLKNLLGEAFVPTLPPAANPLFSSAPSSREGPPSAAYPPLTAQPPASTSKNTPCLPASYPSLTVQKQGITLTLHIGDAEKILKNTPSFQADSWFLDGHDPKKNPALWSPPLLKEVYNHTKFLGTSSTYSVSRDVKEALSAAGFTLSKHPGHPPKRHALLATKH